MSAAQTGRPRIGFRNAYAAPWLPTHVRSGYTRSSRLRRAALRLALDLDGAAIGDNQMTPPVRFAFRDHG